MSWILDCLQLTHLQFCTVALPQPAPNGDFCYHERQSLFIQSSRTIDLKPLHTAWGFEQVFFSQSRFSSGGTEKPIFRKNLKFSAFFLSKISHKFRIQKLNKYVNANSHSTFEFKNPKTLLMQTGRIR